MFQKNHGRINWFAIKTDKGFYRQFQSFENDINELSTVFMYGSKKEALKRFEIAKSRAKQAAKNGIAAAKDFPQTCEIVKVIREPSYF